MFNYFCNPSHCGSLSPLSMKHKEKLQETKLFLPVVILVACSCALSQRILWQRFFIFNPPQLGNKQQNMLPKLHLETGNGKTSFNTLEQEKYWGKTKKGWSSITSKNFLIHCILNSSCTQFLSSYSERGKTMFI